MASHAGLRLRQLMRSGRCLCIPGAFNGLVARLCADAGHKACYLSGGALTASKGLPDIGLLSIDTFTSAIHELSVASGLPVFADADTGFGEVEMIGRTVWEYNHAGAGGLHIEDQEFPKKCGHLDGKRLLPADAFCEKVSRAARARDACSQGKFVVCARTDANAVEGLDSAISRAALYTEAGADMIFPEGLQTEEEFSRFAKAMKHLKGEAPDGGPYLLANMTEFGKTDSISVQRFEQLGYHAVIFPVSTLRLAMKPVQDFLSQLKETGTVDQTTLLKMFTRQVKFETFKVITIHGITYAKATVSDLYKTLHYNPMEEWTYPSSSS
ncbi:carboxyvinyl-carboxyphosphonate phosphorylmutase [Cardiosporidium cionae]|uniref:Carboxyvinyl-carboxyphosphonate phosphorylmutase n=1 Tax=Cardiosporidium cionae TaxID=476202 RepID=A0ABQ7J7V9_9APIC|nr:carboxyvinyl-carboxyphosphonate phosphorylmutase [Cardiosporidium cionae]|eukprot:KAF8820078.1 carboxyvinyl-carboxyphosphonate phosphorylmutase [Cardiosporidium cionae]